MSASTVTGPSSLCPAEEEEEEDDGGGPAGEGGGDLEDAIAPFMDTAAEDEVAAIRWLYLSVPVSAALTLSGAWCTAAVVTADAVLLLTLLVPLPLPSLLPLVSKFPKALFSSSASSSDHRAASPGHGAATTAAAVAAAVAPSSAGAATPDALAAFSASSSSSSSTAL